jgi:hypothetical protein
LSTTTERPSFPEVSSSDTHSRINNGDRRNRRFQRGNTPSVTLRSPKFEGKCNDLKAHIYDCTSIRQADHYTKITKDIAEYIGRTFKFGMDTRLLIENMEIIDIQVPNDPHTEATRTEVRIWEKKVDGYVKRCTI